MEERVGLRRAERRYLAPRAKRRIEFRYFGQSQRSDEFGVSDVGIELAAIDADSIAERMPDLVRRFQCDSLKPGRRHDLAARTRRVDPDSRSGGRPNRSFADLDRLEAEMSMSTYGGLTDMRISVMANGEDHSVSVAGYHGSHACQITATTKLAPRPPQ